MPIEEGHRHPQIDPKTLAKVAKGARLAELQPFVEEVLEDLESKTVMAATKGPLTDHEARDAWTRMAVIRDIRRRFEVLTKEARALGSAIGETLKEGQDG